MACSDKEYYSIVQRGANWARHKVEDLVRAVSHFGCFSKIARDPMVRLRWWRTNQILQVQAHLLVPTRGPGKFVLASNFGSKVFSMPLQMFSSHENRENRQKSMKLRSETRFRELN